MKKSPKWKWLNPIHWLTALFNLFVALITPLLQLFGLTPPPDTDGFDNIQRSDVEDAARTATEKQAAIDLSITQLSPAELVLSYAVASHGQRLTMDLGMLDEAQQDWLLQLDNAHLAVLREGGIKACNRALSRRSVHRVGKGRADTADSACLDDTATQPLDDTARRHIIARRFREKLRATTSDNPDNSFYAPSLH